MNYRLRHLLTVAVLSLLSLHALSAAAQREATDAGAKIPDIHVASFGKARLIGFLGHPLGTVVRVSGTIVDGDTLHTKASQGRTFLRIKSVNGQRLRSPVEFAFGPRASETIQPPKPGENFDYLVHEYGEFDGIVEVPKEFGGEPDMIAHAGFHYRPQLTVHKGLENLKR